MKLSSVSLAIAVATLLAALPHPAAADPHALFYTAIGQQQLFFNTLAALDQADYVETSGLRQRILQNRSGTGFTPETSTFLGRTALPPDQNLSSILTRSITLEGQDLWSAYLAHQGALEIGRLDDSADLLHAYCLNTFSAEECNALRLLYARGDISAEEVRRTLAGLDPRKIIAERARNYLQDPYQAFAGQPYVNGVLAAALSGSPLYQNLVGYLQQQNGNSQEQPIREFSEGIARLRQAAPQILSPVEAMLQEVSLLGAAANFVAADVDPNLYQNTVLDANGIRTLATKPRGAPGPGREVDTADYTLDWFATMARAIDHPRRVNSTLAAAQNSITTQAEGVTNDVTKQINNFRPQLVPNRFAGSANALDAAYRVYLTDPPAIKGQQQVAFVDVFNDLVTDPKAKSLDSFQRQGTVGRTQISPSQAVAGSTDDQSAAGTVASVINRQNSNVTPTTVGQFAPAFELGPLGEYFSLASREVNSRGYQVNQYIESSIQATSDRINSQSDEQ